MKKGTPDQPQMIRVWTHVFVRVIAIIIGLLIAIWLLYKIRTLLLLLLIAVFFSYLLAPIVSLFESPIYIRGREVKLPRWAAILAVYVVVGSVLFIAMQIFLPMLWEQVTQLTTNLPTYMTSASANINKTIKDANSWMRHLNLSPNVQDYLQEQISQVAQALLPWLRENLLGLLTYLQYLPWLILIPIISFFMLKDAHSFGEAFVESLPNEKLKKRVRWMLLDMSKTIALYIRAQITACIVVGFLVGLGLAIIGAPYAIVLGVLAALMEFVPLAGPLIAAVVIFSLTAIYSFKTALVAAVFLLVLRLVQDYVIYPRIIGEGIHMPPFLVIMAILAGAEIAGLLGIFFSIPVVGLILVVFHHYRAYKGLEKIRAEAVEIDSIQLMPSESPPPEMTS
ncbi:MAG: AI-2E family transporter [Acidobacteria bacterium]|nr:AI-2E family transporter [Acidobacteriota bacterium]